jgi:hypothetical protein
MKKWVRLILQIVGALSLALFVIAAVVIGWDAYTAMSEHINKATPRDTLFILNWGGIPTNQNYKVIGSYQSRRSFTGDHLDYYCIELPKFEVADEQKNQWHDGPEENPLLAEALELAVSNAHVDLPCFPPFEQVNSKAMKIKFENVTLHDGFPEGVDIILYDTERRMLYYVSFMT